MPTSTQAARSCIPEHELHTLPAGNVADHVKEHYSSPASLAGHRPGSARVLVRGDACGSSPFRCEPVTRRIASMNAREATLGSFAVVESPGLDAPAGLAAAAAGRRGAFGYQLCLPAILWRADRNSLVSSGWEVGTDAHGGTRG